MMVMALNMSIELHANYACKTTEKLCSKIRCDTDTTPWLKCLAAAIEIREQISEICHSYFHIEFFTFKWYNEEYYSFDAEFKQIACS